MKKIILLFLFPFLGSAQNTELDKKNGFANFVFGTAPTEYKNLVLEMDEGTSKLYSLDQSPIKIDGIDFAHVRVTFHRNKLAVISLQTKNSMGTTFLQALKAKYGEPKLNAKHRMYEWTGKKVQLSFSNNNSLDKDASVEFITK